jgi:TolB protein
VIRPLLAWVALCASPCLALAQDRVTIQVTGAERPIPVAVQRFAEDASSPGLSAELYQAVIEGLDFSSVIIHVNPEAFVESKVTQDFEAPAVPCENWRAIGAEGLVQGELRVQQNKAQVRFRVWDTSRCRLLGELAFRERERSELRKLARIVADDIVERFTGRRGVSSTEIAFVSDSGKRNKEIWVMDADGANKRRVTNNGSVNLFPAWSPDGQTLLYTSFKGGLSELFLLYRGTRPGKKLIPTRDEKFRGVFVPRDGQIAAVVSRQGNTDIYAVDGNGGNPKRITDNRAIESSPTFSPDGRRMAFVSDRTGSPQVWIKDLDTGAEQRLTYNGSYNASPAWSPTGEWIAYAAQAGNNFDIYIINPEGTFTTPVVSHGRSDEDPAWSPDGRKLAFSSNRRGRKELYRVDVTGQNTQLLTESSGACSNPAWSTWLD